MRKHGNALGYGVNIEVFHRSIDAIEAVAAEVYRVGGYFPLGGKHKRYRGRVVDGHKEIRAVFQRFHLRIHIGGRVAGSVVSERRFGNFGKFRSIQRRFERIVNAFGIGVVRTIEDA